MDDFTLAEAKQREMNELKQDTIDVSVFNEIGTLEKHTPLEIIDFIG
jgi:hypothetical protein